MKKPLIILILVVTMIGCKKNNEPELKNDCFQKTTVYDSSNEIRDWFISYYSDGNEIKYETKFGIEWEQKFDNRGNRILFTSEDYRVEYEFNTYNQEIKAAYYSNNQLDTYHLSIYKDTLLDKSYTINKTNDTIGWQFYFYNTENKIDSIIYDDRDVYFYYSAEIDSVITKSKENSIISRQFLKYKDGKRIYAEGKSYSHFGQEMLYINTWEYNENQLLTRQTEYRSYISGETQWTDLRNIFDNKHKLSRVEYYDKSNNLTSYSKYIYENEILLKIESFDINNILKSYTIIENTCIE